MAVTTPSYWQEEQYQPLIEVETAYGNKVKIPEKLLLAWKYRQQMMESMVKQYGQEKADTLIKERVPKRKHGKVLYKVFLEEYKE